MRRLLTAVIVVILCSYALSQDDHDDDFRLCDGMPANQTAFAVALNGDLQNAAIEILKDVQMNTDQIRIAFVKLFLPLPTSLSQLNARAFLAAKDAQTGNKLQMRFNQIVTSQLHSLGHPDDVVCSISLLSYREASDVFGKRIANQYGVVQ